MPVNYNNATKRARMEAVLDEIDADASEATVEIGDTGFTNVLVEIELSKPSFSLSAAAADPVVLTMLGVPKSGDATATGTGVVARIKDGAGNIVISGLSVGTAAPAEIILNSTAISQNQTVTLTQGTLTHAADVP